MHIRQRFPCHPYRKNISYASSGGWATYSSGFFNFNFDLRIGAYCPQSGSTGHTGYGYAITSSRLARPPPAVQAFPVPFNDGLDTDMQLISFPGDNQVNVTILHFQPLSDVSKYRDPFHTLLKYIAIVRVLE